MVLIKWAGHVACMGHTQCTQNVAVTLHRPPINLQIKSVKGNVVDLAAQWLRNFVHAVRSKIQGFFFLHISHEHYDSRNIHPDNGNIRFLRSPGKSCQATRIRIPNGTEPSTSVMD